MVAIVVHRRKLVPVVPVPLHPSAFTDNFNRSNRNLSGDNGWTQVNNAQIVSNQVQRTDTAVYLTAARMEPEGATYVEVAVDNFRPSNNGASYLFLNHTAGAPNAQVGGATGYEWYFDASGGYGDLRKITAGTASVLASTELTTINWTGSTARLTLRRYGSLISVFVNGTKILEATDASPLPVSGTRYAGFYSTPSAPATEYWDNYQLSTFDNFTDNFDRSDRALNGDNGWTDRGNSGWQIVSNKAQLPRDRSYTGYYLDRACNVASGTVQATLFLPHLFKQPGGLHVGGFRVVVENGGLGLYENGASRQTFDTVTRSSLSGTLKVEWTPTTVKAFINDTQIGATLTRAFSTTPAAMGPYTTNDSTATGANTFDNFQFVSS